MIDCQLRPNRIKNPLLLDAFHRIPRELFVCPEHQKLSYLDEEVSCGQGRMMLSPLVCAHLIQELELEDTDKVLVVAAGTGYSTALVSRLVGKVCALEENVRLQDVLRKNIAEMQMDNVKLIKGKLAGGSPKNMPFDKILFDAPVQDVPQGIVQQLRDGGKLAAVCEGADGLMEATIFNKIGKTLFNQALFETKGTPLPGFTREEQFVF